MATLSNHTARGVVMRVSIILIVSAVLSAGLFSVRQDLQAVYTLHQLRRIYPDDDLVTLRYCDDEWIEFDVDHAPQEKAGVD